MATSAIILPTTIKKGLEMTKTYKYPKNWFKHNLIPVPTGTTGGNCSACIFRNNKPYCEMMSCTYIDMSDESDYIESVYWIGSETHANIGMWPELRKFFDTMPKQRLRDISGDIMTKAVLLKTKEKSH